MEKPFFRFFQRGPMPLEIARDIMLPLEQYAVVSEDTTMIEALHALAAAQNLVPKDRHPHRAVLIKNAEGNIIGKLGHHAFLAALEPHYLKVGQPHAFSSEGYSRDFLLSIMQHMSLWQGDFNSYTRRAMNTKVGEVMHPVAEHVDIEATIGEVIHKLIMYCVLSLIVTENDTPVGIIRLSDIFFVVSKNLRKRAALLTEEDAKEQT
jgi:CBS domain-containing protein